MPFGDLFKLPEGFKRPRSAPNRMEGLTFPQKINYMGQFEGPSLMALGAGISEGDAAQGFRDMAKIQAGYQGAYADEAEQDRTRADVMQYLTGLPGITPQEAELASRNPGIMEHLLAPKAKRNLIEVDGQIYDADTNEWISPGGAGGGGLDLGNSTEARGLEYLIQQRILTERQAAEIAGGRPVTLADGSVIFKGASDLAGGGQIMVQQPGQSPQPIEGGGAPAAPAPGGAVAPAPGVGTGGTILSPPKPVTGTESERRAQLLYGPMKQQLQTALVNYDQLSSKMGLAVRVGEKLPGVGGAVKVLGDYATTPEYQQARNAIKTIYTNWLYATSGATANPSEQETQADLLMPRPGESTESVNRKKQQLRDYVEGVGKAQGVLGGVAPVGGNGGGEGGGNHVPTWNPRTQRFE